MIATQEKTAPRWSFGQAAIAGGEAYGKHGGFGRDCKLDPHTLEILRPRLVEYLTGIGIQLHRRGARLVGRCPVHNDRNPSFAVFPGGQACGCYPCGFTGDVFDLSRWLRRTSTFAEAIADIATVLGVQPQHEGGHSSPRPPQTHPPPAPRSEQRSFTLTDAEREKHHAARLAFSDAYDAGQINALADELGIPLWAFRWCAKGRSGLGWLDGRLCYLYPEGMKLRNRAGASPRFRWVCGRATEPWRMGWASKPEVTTIVISEGESDCLALVAAGLEADGTAACVAAPGTGFKREWGPLFAGRKVIICFDLDEPGRKAAAGVAEILRPFAAKVLTWKGPRL